MRIAGGTAETDYKQGEHICAFYTTRGELLQTAAEYVADGLRSSRRCFVVTASSHVHSRFRWELARLGVDVSDAIRSRALLEGLHADVHLAKGGFNTTRHHNAALAHDRLMIVDEPTVPVLGCSAPLVDALKTPRARVYSVASWSAY